MYKYILAIFQGVSLTFAIGQNLVVAVKEPKVEISILPKSILTILINFIQNVAPKNSNKTNESHYNKN